MNRPVIYADHAATTALSPRAFEAMRPFLTDNYANPSTLYHLAHSPKQALILAREQIAASVGASPDEIYFTSCGTEADNWAIITSNIEHHAVLRPCAFLKRMGYEIIYLPVDSYGIVRAETLEAAITDDTILISVMTANNEIGTIEPIRRLAAVARRHGVPFHTDAVQAVGHIPLDVQEMGIDLLSASAHKFNGPKGVGFLYIRKGISIEPLFHGGGQESGIRAGTENIAGIVGMATALSEHMETLDSDAQKLEFLRSRLLSYLKESGIRFIVNGSENHMPGSISVSFCEADGEALLHRLDLMGIAIATGSACNSKETVLSHVIQAIGVPENYANGTIRITLGMDNDEEQIKTIANALVKILTSEI